MREWRVSAAGVLEPPFCSCVFVAQSSKRELPVIVHPLLYADFTFNESTKCLMVCSNPGK